MLITSSWPKIALDSEFPLHANNSESVLQRAKSIGKRVWMKTVCFTFSILLHARVQDYATCTAIAHIWLHHADNFHSRDYAAVCELYVTHVLIPQSRWDDIPSFIDSCCGLDAKTKSTYMKHVWSLRHQEEQAHIDEIEHLETSVDDDEQRSAQSRPSCVTGRIYIQELYQSFCLILY